MKKTNTPRTSRIVKEQFDLFPAAWTVISTAFLLFAFKPHSKSFIEDVMSTSFFGDALELCSFKADRRVKCVHVVFEYE